MVQFSIKSLSCPSPSSSSGSHSFIRYEQTHDLFSIDKSDYKSPRDLYLEGH
jgi:hypothetical protein